MENNKTYCRMPFVGFQSAHGGCRLCCGVSGPDRSNLISGKEFWNSEYLSEVRKKMEKGDRVPACQKCYDEETLGKLSLRNHYNARYKDLNEMESPTALDLDFSNLCNLQCVMCGPDRSSQWAKELGNKEVLSISKDKLDIICKMSHNVKYLTIQGGEPSLMPEFEYYFQYLKDNKLIHNIKVDCISNLTNTNNKFYYLLDEFKTVDLNASVDSFGLVNNYIRYPSNFEKIEKNLIKLSEKKIQVNLQITLQVLGMFNFYEFLMWIADMQQKFKQNNKDLGLNLSYVTGHPYLDIRNAPKKLKQKMLEDINNFSKKHKIRNNLKFNIGLKNLKKILTTPQQMNASKELQSYIHSIDTRRSIKVTNYIPDFFKYL
jgi:pyruvate-formate lyase-activating enzyme